MTEETLEEMAKRDEEIIDKEIHKKLDELKKKLELLEKKVNQKPATNLQLN